LNKETEGSIFKVSKEKKPRRAEEKKRVERERETCLSHLLTHKKKKYEGKRDSGRGIPMAFSIELSRKN